MKKKKYCTGAGMGYEILFYTNERTLNRIFDSKCINSHCTNQSVS